MTVTETPLPGVLVVEPRVHRDGRGAFWETYHEGRYVAAGIDARFVQTNVSRSRGGTLRGLHFQAPPHAQAKLVSVLDGAIFDVAVDLRPGSPTFGAWFGMDLTAESMQQVFVPEGFAHGFVVTSETALVSYACSAVYAPEAERSIAWDDPDIGIAWSVAAPVLSEKDASAPQLADLVSTFGGRAGARRDARNPTRPA